MSSSPWTPPPDALAVWEDGERRRAFFHEHWIEFARDYPDQFVDVKDGEVVAKAPDLDEFDRRLQELQLTPRDVWAKYIAVMKVNYIV